VIASETTPREPYHQSLSLGPLRRRFLTSHRASVRVPADHVTSFDVLRLHPFAHSLLLDRCSFPHDQVLLSVTPQSLLPKTRGLPILHRPMSQARTALKAVVPPTPHDAHSTSQVGSLFGTIFFPNARIPVYGFLFRTFLLFLRARPTALVSLFYLSLLSLSVTAPLRP
jgi:hypothetical protein